MKTSTFKQLATYIRPHKGLFIGIVVFSFLTVLCQILIPIQVGRAVNAIHGIQKVDFSAVLTQIAILIGFAVGASITQFIQNELTNRLTYQITEHLRSDFFHKIQSLPLSAIDGHSYGDIVSRAVNDVELTGNGLLQAFLSFFTGIGMIIGILVIMLMLNIKIGLLVIVLTPLSVIVSGIIARRTYHYFQEQMRLRGILGAQVDEFAANQYLVKAFNYETASLEQFKSINQEVHESGVRSQFAGALINPTMRVLNSIVYAAVGIFGGWSVLAGTLSVGLFTSFLTYANQYMKPFNEISNVINEMQTAMASAGRLFNFLAQPSEKPSQAQGTLSNVHGQVTIQDLYFSYQPSRPLIEDLNVQVHAGETVAIVGPTGAGKTTLINLLMRFYEPDSGEIQIDGVNTQRLSRNNLRQQFGMVLQDAWIFKGTVLENICYGSPNATREEAIAAAKKASVHRLIEQMDDGYDAMLEENGSNISQGQKQLICITRIMLSDPEMLILDEATSSIDTLTEQIVQRSFDTLMEGRTTFVVAHRLSTIQNAEMILVMNHGHVVEQGNHRALLDQHGFYYHLYNSQFDTQTA
ncbi:MAG: ABC transporter ATP-binding protein [Aerococcus sp.]|nr:ABC transporter ATP-binding protein [Aerococcus sp.]